MRLHTPPVTAIEIPPPQTSGTLEQRFALFGGMALILTLALLMPGVAQPEHYHAFADQREWLGLPHGADVLSNLGFMLAGFAGWVMLLRADHQRLKGTARALCALFFLGLLCSGIGSAVYHWAPNNDSLLWDRMGMGVAFSGLLGLAVQTRIDDMSARVTTGAVLMAAPVSLWVWGKTGNVLPWALLQAGGMLLVLWLAFLSPRRHAMPLELGWGIGLYAVAKLLEMSDGDVFDASAHVIAGHSLKHVVAAAAAWPILSVLHRWRAEH